MKNFLASSSPLARLPNIAADKACRAGRLIRNDSCLYACCMKLYLLLKGAPDVKWIRSIRVLYSPHGHIHLHSKGNGSKDSLLSSGKEKKPAAFQ